jgi:photosystem II stability/assembly factor-like uncharacterized protein
VNPDRDPLDEKAIAAVRAHFDGEVAEARARFRAPRLSGRTSRSGRGSGRGVPRAIGALAVVALAILVGTTAWMVSRNSPAVAGPSASPTHAVAAVTTATPSLVPPSLVPPSIATPSASPTQSAAPNIATPNYLLGTVGMNGSAAWALSDSGLSMSQDGGRTWSAVALPTGVQSSAVKEVSAVVGRAVWLAVNGKAGVVVYRKSGTDAWTSTAPLLPSWAAAAEWAGQPVQAVGVTPGPAGLVTVTETIGLGNFTAAEALFVSTDDGHTFAQHPPKAPSSSTYWSSFAFATSQTGALVSGAGTYPHDINYTSDGGNTWAKATVTGLPASGVGDYELGQLLLVGSDIELPVTTFATGSTDYTFLLLVSHDGGATFAPAGATIPSVGNAYPAFDSLGQVSWAVFGAAAVHETADGGQTWTTVTAAGLPKGVASIHLTGATSATAVVAETGCTGFKTGCYNRTYLVATTDGGATWSNL